MKKMKKLSLCMAVMLILAMLLPACTPAQDTQTPAQVTDAPAPAQSNETQAPAEPEEVVSQGITDTEILIGCTFPTSGPYAFIGVPVMDTIKGMYDRINARGGINGRMIKIVYYDDGYDPATGQTLVQKLVEEDKVFALSCMGGNIVANTLPYLRDYGIPVVNITSGLASIYRDSDPGGAVFPVQPSSSTDGAMLIARVLHESLFGPNKDQKLPADAKIAVVHTTDEASLNTLDTLLLQAEKEGAKDRLLVETVTAATYAASIEKLKSQGASIVIFLALDSKGFIAAMDDAGWEVPWFGAYGTSTVQSFSPDTYKPGRPCYSTMWADYSTDAAKAMLADLDDALTYNKDLTQETRDSYKENNYARAGYAAASTMAQALARMDENDMDMNWENFIKAMEMAPLDFGGVAFSYANGVRQGIQVLSLAEYYVENGEGKQRMTRGFESIEEVMAK